MLIIVGVVLLFTPAAEIAPFVIEAGVALTIGGIMTLFFGPKNPLAGTDRGEQTDQNPSYLFNGPVNTIKQGGPVPLLYGRMMVGSQVISSGITTSQLPDTTVLSEAQSPEPDDRRVFLDTRWFTGLAAKATPNVYDDPQRVLRSGKWIRPPRSRWRPRCSSTPRA